MCIRDSVCRGRARQSANRVFDGNGCARNDCARRISHCSDDRSAVACSLPEAVSYTHLLASLHGKPIVVGNRALFEELGIAHPRRETGKERGGTEGGTEVLVARGGRYYGSILITDQLRPSAAPAIEALAHMNIKVVLLTGDSKAAAEAVADELGIIQFYYELLPAQKTAFITEEVKKGRTVAMLGLSLIHI